MFRHSLLLLPMFALALVTAIPKASAEKLHCPNVTDNDEKNTEIARRYFQMGGMFLDKSDFTKAAESFECVLKFVPYSLTARYKLARAYDGLEVYSKAREQYELILVYDSKDAESLKPEIRRRLAEIKDLKDKVQTTVVAVEAPSTDEKTCPSVVQKSLQEVLAKATRLLDAKDWAKGRTLIGDALRKLDGATVEQRKLCFSTDAGLQLLLYFGIANFHLNNLEEARENFTVAFRIRSDVNLPARHAGARLLAFYQETLNAYFEQVKAEKARQLRIKELEENFGVPTEAAENPSTPIEHTPPAVVTEGKPLVFVCRVQDELGATQVRIVYRLDDGPAQEMSLEKLGQRRYALVLPGEKVTFARLSYHLVALTGEGKQAGLWGSTAQPHVLVLRAEKPVEKPVDKPVDQPADKPVVTPPPKKPWSPGFFVNLGIGFEIGFISEDKETEAGAITDNASFGSGPAVFSLELGYFLSPRDRLSALVGMGGLDVEGYEDDNSGRYKESRMTARVLARYARFFGTGRLRFFGGAGLGWASLSHTVETDGRAGETNILMDAHTMAGLFTDVLFGAQVCLIASCRLTAHAELNVYWNAWSRDGEENSFTNMALHFLAGIGYHF